MKRTVLAIVGLALAASVVVPPPASAKPIEHGSFHDEFNLVHKDFCGVPGLTVSDVGTAEVRYRLNSQGKAGLAYYLQHVNEHGTVTDLATGKSVTFWLLVNSKDLHVTDNGDGTLTVVALSTGNYVFYDDSGKAIGRNPGQYRDKFLLDTQGTPDIFDDEFIALLEVIKQSTGRNDDPCEVMLQGLGVSAP